MKLGILAAAAVLALFSVSTLASAQVASSDESALARAGVFARDRNIAVRQRPQPDYAPAGAHLGAFTVYPTLGLSLEGDDNIYAVPAATDSSAIVHVTPNIFAVSNWSRHQLTAFARASDNEFLSHSAESTTDYAFGAAGRLDIDHGTGADAGLSYERDTEPRTSPNSPVAALEPTRYAVTDGYVGVAHAFNRLRLSARGEARDFSFDNVPSRPSGFFYEKNRDRTELTGSFRGEYAVSPATSVFATVGGNQRNYRNQLAGIPDRSSSGYELNVGANFDVTRLVRGEVAAGYLKQSYDGGYRSVSGPTVRGRVEYFPTQITTVSLTASRTVEESVLTAAGGYLSTNVSAQIDHELLRNVVLTAHVAYGADDYRGIDRTDNRVLFLVGATYLMNRGLALNVQYSHYSNDSGGPSRGLSYDINRVTVGATLRY